MFIPKIASSTETLWNKGDIVQITVDFLFINGTFKSGHVFKCINVIASNGWGELIDLQDDRGRQMLEIGDMSFDRLKRIGKFENGKWPKYLKPWKDYNSIV